MIAATLGTIPPKNLGRRQGELEIRGRIETILTKILRKLARILRKVLEIWGDLLSLRLHQKTPARDSVKNSQIIIIIIIIIWRRPDLILINKKKRTCLLGDFAVQADHRIKIRESEKINKYMYIAKELKMLRKRDWWGWDWRSEEESRLSRLKRG